MVKIGKKYVKRMAKVEENGFSQKILSVVIPKDFEENAV